MRRLLYLAALSMVVTLLFAPTAMAQNAACQDVQDRLNAGDSTLTSAELLACGLSPEAISPCEGVPDPNCNAEGFPSIGGPSGVGENNACSGLPPGSAEAIACYEELIANMGATPTATTEQYTPPVAAEQYTPAAPALPITGGPALLLPAAGVLLGAGLLGLRLVRRS